MTVAMEEQEQETVSSAASGWLVLLKTGDATSEDRRRFADWLAAHPGHPVAYREAERFWEGMDCLDQQDVRELDRYLEDHTSDSRIASPVGRGACSWHLTAIAATALLVTAASLWMTMVWHPRGDYRTVIGQQQTITLADGSTVHLNTDTAISVALGDNTRRIRLHRGEAFFTVAPDALRPFEVTAGNGIVRALGTAFNVRADADHVTVTVSEHSIQITTHGDETAEVRTGERVSYGADGRIGPKEPVDVTRALAWQRHRLIFENQPLPEVLDELARYRSGWIILRDPSLRTLPVTGSFDTGRPDHVLPAIEESLPIRAVRLTDWLILLHRDHSRKR
jgi:transmembrane sensor